MGRWTGWWALGLVVALACSVPAPPPAPAPAPAAERNQPAAAGAPSPPPRATVRVGHAPALSNAGMYLASERGYFAEEGLDIEYVSFDAAARMIAALGADQLDVGAGGASAGLFNAVARGVGLRIVGPLARHEPGHSGVHITVRQDLVENGSIRDYPDFRGRTVAIAAKASVNEYAAHLLAERGGFPASELNLVELGFPDMVSAFANGAIDAAIQADPTATVAAERGSAVKWREIADLEPRFQFTVVLYSAALATERADVGRRWMTAYLRGVRDYHEAGVLGRDRATILAVAGRYVPIADPALFERSGWTIVDPNGEIDRPSLEGQLRWLIAQGAVPPSVTLDALLDSRFAAAAVERLGRY
ncbi:MAG: ABC transporter substrate-binding protein [Chloroflexi bacterium]|mgnify:CR=1 FL=1|nr:ABC transporter substrate-binding protein [Chloroflexota bacterium]